ncbi:MAG TPA: TadE/TadG family type IV pilus assembly protein [Acidimicrobiia bacterium]|jgi:hypothetical protein
MTETHQHERGAALVEFAMVFAFLLMMAIGAFEWGMGFRDSVSVNSAAREGARVGSSAGDNAQADCRILEAAAGALQAISGNQVAQLWIYRTDTAGTVSTARNVYRPALPTDNPASLRCGTWFPISQNWAETSRDNDGATRDWLGVQILYDHRWHTGFMWWNGTVQWAERAVMHLEPSVGA